MELKPGADFNNEETGRTFRIQKTLITISWITYAIVMASGFYINDLRLVTVTLVGSALQLFPFIMLRRGNLRASSLLIVINAIGTVTFIAIVGQGVRDLAMIAYPIVFVFAGLTLDKIYFRISVGLALLCVSCLAISESMGWFFPQPFNGEYTIWIYLIMVSLLLVVGAVAVDLLAANMHRNLEKARLEIEERKRIEAALVESEERFKLSMDATNDGLWDWNIKTDECYFSPRYFRMLGYEPGDFPMTGSGWNELLHLDDQEYAVRVNTDCIEGRCDQFEVEYRLKTKDGDWCWILARGKSVARDTQGRSVRMLGTHMDIHARKQAEEELRFQSTHDALTGIYNRAFFETELERLERGREFPVSVVMADVDRLKITNDTLGHAAGDQLLQRAADLLCSIIRVGDILARIGGDEFLALLPATDLTSAEQIIIRIQDGLADHNSKYPEKPVYLSLGVATANNHSIVDAFKQADQSMYAEKARRKSIQNNAQNE